MRPRKQSLRQKMALKLARGVILRQRLHSLEAAELLLPTWTDGALTDGYPLRSLVFHACEVGDMVEVTLASRARYRAKLGHIPEIAAALRRETGPHELLALFTTRDDRTDVMLYERHEEDTYGR